MMGNRIICFLTTYLPRHPDFDNSDLSELREETMYELERLRLCMEDVALQIDEDQLNRYISDDFEPVIDDDSVGSLENGNGAKENNKDSSWETFSGWQIEFGRKQADSPTAETLETTGTEVSSDESDKGLVEIVSAVPRRIFEGDQEQKEEPYPRKFYIEEEEDDYFLEKIANEDVVYESDSEALDSWAQDTDSALTYASSGIGITCDPARVALRDMLTRLPDSFDSPLKIGKRETSDSPLSYIVPHQNKPKENLLKTTSSDTSMKESRVTSVSPVGFSRFDEGTKQFGALEQEKSDSDDKGLHIGGSSNHNSNLDIFQWKADLLGSDEWVNFGSFDSRTKCALPSF